MKVSLVMAVYNGEKYLIEQLDSIRKQTYLIDEVILIDDVSTDNSYELIHQYIDGYKLINWKLVENENNLGYRKNFKKGLEIVDGDIIFLSDQDDRWHLNKIEVMVEKMSQSNILSLASSFNFMDQDGNCFEIEKQKGKSNNNLLFQEVNNELTKVNLKTVLQSNFSQGCCMAIKKELLKIYLNENNDSVPHDWALNALSAVNDGCYYLNQVLIDYRIHNNNTIGLENLLDEKSILKKRVNRRISFLNEQESIANYLISKKLDNNSLCIRYQQYLEKRKKYMYEKKIFSCLIYYIRGGYKEFGSLKTWLGDITNIVHQ